MNIKLTIIIAIILSFIIQDLKISSNGIYLGTLGTESGPFIYEVLIAFFIFIAIAKIIIDGITPLNKPYRFLFFIFAGLFIFNFMIEPDYKYLFGFGSLRMFIFCSGFFLCASCYNYDYKDLKYIIFALVLIAVVNSIYSILLYLNIFAPIFPYAMRLGFMRYSGFSQSPAYAGPMLSTAIALLLPFAGKRENVLSRNYILCIIAILSAGLALSMSRSGMVAVLGAVTVYLILRPEYLYSFFVGLVFALMFYFVINSIESGIVIKSFNFINKYRQGQGLGEEASRINLIIAALSIAINNPLGIPWGSFEFYDPMHLVEQEPHNLYALILIYGGVLALILFIYIVASVLAKFMSHYNKEPIVTQSLYLGVISLLIYALFEIALYHVIVVFPLLLFLAILINIDSFTKNKKPLRGNLAIFAIERHNP
jgi:hypothetical protein